MNRQGSTVLIVAKVSLRAAEDGDAAFLRRLYASTRQAEMDAVGWPDDMRRQFLDDQFHLQDLHYRQHHPAAARHIVLFKRKPAGRLYLNRDGDSLHVVDISLLSERRGCGVGAALLGWVQKTATAEGRRSTLAVYLDNPALRLYERLGYRPIERQGPRCIMEWRPGQAP